MIELIIAIIIQISTLTGDITTTTISEVTDNATGVKVTKTRSTTTRDGGTGTWDDNN